MTIRKLDYIDALRGIAILGVLMIHTNQFGNSNLPGVMANIIGQGAKGVQLFYIASAFTLFLSFKNRFTKEKFPIRNFFLRRFFRIAPMYYLGIIYYIFQDGLGARYWLGNETHITVLNILSNFTFLHAFNPYWINSLVPGGWSIGVEMMFYAVFPYLFLKIKNLKYAFNFFVISIILRMMLQLFFLKFNLISDNRLWGEYLLFYFPSQLPIFSLGILLYYIIIEKESAKSISLKSVIVFIFLLILQITSRINFISNHILFGIIFLFLAITLSTFKFKLLVNPIVNYIGKISFSMYLVHFAVLNFLTHYNIINYSNNGIINYSVRFFIVTILTVTISSILYKFIEIPFQEIGKLIIFKLEKESMHSKRIAIT